MAPNGQILVVSTSEGILVFDSKFKYVGRWKPAQEPGMFPEIRSVAVRPDGKIVVASDSHLKVFMWLLGTDGLFKVTGETEEFFIGESSVAAENNVCVDKYGNIFTARGQNIIRIESP